MFQFLPKLIAKKYIIQALEEDIGPGDLTTSSIVSPGQKVKAVFNSREEGILCGVEVIKILFEELDPCIDIEVLKNDGQRILKGEDIAIIKGNTASVLIGERTALNFLQKMSAISTLTAKLLFNKTQELLIKFAISAPTTTHSNKELLASLFAPCKEVQLTSPTAKRPSIDVFPSGFIFIPPIT